MKVLRAYRSLVAWLLLALYLPACTSTHVVATPPPAQLVESLHPPAIQLTLDQQGTNLAMQSPAVSGDSLVGRVRGQPRSLALSDIASVSASKPIKISWRRGTPTPAQYLEAKQPPSIKVTRLDGSRLKLASPVLRGDSIVSGVSSAEKPGEQGLAVGDVAQVTVTKANIYGTALLVGAVVGVIVLVNAFINCPSCD